MKQRPRPARPGPPRGGGRVPQRRERGLGGEQVEGRRAVRELLVARARPVRDVWTAEGMEPAPILREINDLARRARVPVRVVGRRAFDAQARTDGAQGVLAHAQALLERDFEELCRPERGTPFLLAFDGVTDPQNLGALLRSGEGAGITGAVLARHRAVHVTPAVTKAAAGAVERVPMAVVPGLAAAVARAKTLGVWVVGLDAGAPTSLFDLTLATEPVMLVLGAEGSGLSRLVAERCDLLVSIPLRGAISSLNVAAAGALAAFEISRRR